jgi:adenine/guanine phosphoribosyltransferase-like PRPP-binding protein
VIAQTNYAFMKEHGLYRAAKDGVSSSAALSLVYDCIADNAVDLIREALGSSRPRIIGVHAEEATGRNKIPSAYAEVLAAILGLVTDPGVVQASVANHSGAKSIYHRFASQPSFDGYVEKGVDYLLVDDTCTAGGTLTNLKGFVEANGGNVVAMSVLSLGGQSLTYDISLAPWTLARLNRRHRDLDAVWREEFGYGVDALTEGEAGHLLAAPSVDTIRNRLIEARRDLNLLGDENSDERASESSKEVD